VDLLIESAFGEVVAVEIKLNKTPSVSLASALAKFPTAFPRLTVRESILLSLAGQSIPLSRQVKASSLDDYLRGLVDKIELS
jgi:hypothetical protein